MEEAANFHLKALLEGEPGAFNATLMTFEEYAELVHPHLPEAERMSADTSGKLSPEFVAPLTCPLKWALQPKGLEA